MGHLIYSAVIGIVAGAIASHFMGSKHGLVVDLILGLVGGVVGGHLLAWLGVKWDNLLGKIGTATAGAIVLLWVLRLL